MEDGWTIFCQWMQNQRKQPGQISHLVERHSRIKYCNHRYSFIPYRFINGSMRVSWSRYPTSPLAYDTIEEHTRLNPRYAYGFKQLTKTNHAFRVRTY